METDQSRQRCQRCRKPLFDGFNPLPERERAKVSKKTYTPIRNHQKKRRKRDCLDRYIYTKNIYSNTDQQRIKAVNFFFDTFMTPIVETRSSSELKPSNRCREWH